MRLCELATTITCEYGNKVLATLKLSCHEKVKLNVENFKKYLNDNNTFLTFSKDDRGQTLVIGKYHDNVEEAIKWSTAMKHEINLFLGNL